MSDASNPWGEMAMVPSEAMKAGVTGVTLKHGDARRGGLAAVLAMAPAVRSMRAVPLMLVLILGLAPLRPSLAQDHAFGPTPSAPGAAVSFIDLKDGATIGTKTLIKFGLKNMAIAPAGSPLPNSGHHHLLIDTELPPFDRPIPNDFKHLHFGRGQTEAEVTLTPGVHTLQLILGDKNHIPLNPPVVSDRITVTVTETATPPQAAQDESKDQDQSKDHDHDGMTMTPPAPSASSASSAASTSSSYARKPAPAGAKVYIISPANGAVIAPTSLVRFGLSGMGVAPAGFDKANTGHHHLLIDTPLPPFDVPVPNDFHHLHFGLGQTEAQIKLTPGPHTLQLLLADAGHVPHDPPVYSSVVHVTVTATGKRSRSHRHRGHHLSRE